LRNKLTRRLVFIRGTRLRTAGRGSSDRRPDRQERIFPHAGAGLSPWRLARWNPPFATAERISAWDAASSPTAPWRPVVSSGWARSN